MERAGEGIGWVAGVVRSQVGILEGSERARHAPLAVVQKEGKTEAERPGEGGGEEKAVWAMWSPGHVGPLKPYVG